MSLFQKFILSATLLVFSLSVIPCQPAPENMAVPAVSPFARDLSLFDEVLPLEARPVLSPDQNYAFLTFDDGPTKNTEKILDILNHYGIKATFFVIGHSINGRNDSQKILKRILDEGHYIGLHSMSHQAKSLYYDEGAAMNFLAEMSELQEMVYELTGGFSSNLCRAPYGTVGTFTDSHVAAITASPLLCWDWNVDTSDWELDDVGQLLEKVKFDLYHRQHSPHAVILFHEMDITVEALPLVIEYLLEEGYELRGYDPDLHFPINFLGRPDF